METIDLKTTNDDIKAFDELVNYATNNQLDYYNIARNSRSSNSRISRGSKLFRNRVRKQPGQEPIGTLGAYILFAFIHYFKMFLYNLKTDIMNERGYRRAYQGNQTRRHFAAYGK